MQERATTLAVAFLYPRESVRIRGKRFLVPSPTRTAASAVSSATTRTSAAPTASTVAATAAGSSAASTTISAVRTIALRTITACQRRAVAIEVRFGIRFVGEVAAAFDHHCAGCNGSRYEFAFRRSGHRRGFAAAHFCALLFQNCLARKPDAIALNREHLHQHLIAFLQFVAHIGDAMLGDFADVQQAEIGR